MSDVKQTIQVTNTGLSPILSIAQGTGMVDFEFTISDFQIPAGSTAVAWNIQPTGNIVSQVCTLAGNVITVTPPAYYFLRGKNYMQIQVTGADGVNLFTFLIEVWCSPNISAPVVSQNPDLISQLMAMIGNTQDLDTTAKNNLVAAINEIYGRGVVDILDTEEEIEANTDTGKATGALVTKQLISEIGDISGITNQMYNSIGALLQYYINNGYLPDINSTPLIPKLTANNSRILTDSTNPNYLAWQAFDQNPSTYFLCEGTYIGYDFLKNVSVKKITWSGYNQGAFPGFGGSAKLQASDNKSSWIDVANIPGNGTGAPSEEFTVPVIQSHRYWRVNNGADFGLYSLQFYGT